uniref:Uncharacterized protein n=1 Tax=Caenorhabditis tropicalis TaxID=1561998 RepID=A0A1I7TGQ5_9PELO
MERVEMKLECMKTLDLKTRWNLHNTSHTERALVDSQRVKIYKMKFEQARYFTQSTPRDCMSVDRTKLNVDPNYSKFVFEHGIFENLEIKLSYMVFQILEIHLKKGGISAKNLTFTSMIPNSPCLFEKFNDQLLDTLVIDGFINSLDQLISAPVCCNSK